MALSAQEVSIILKAQDQASAIIKSVSGDLTKLGNSAKQAGPSWLSMSSAVAAGTTAATAFMGVARGLTSVFMSAASSSADFGQSMADIRSLVPTADFQQFGGQVQALAMRLGKDYPLSAAEAGKAMTLMAQKGISLEQMLNGGAEAVVKLTSATGADLVTSAGIAANALDTFGVSAEDMGTVTNLMVGAMTRGGVSATDYGFAMAAAGAVINMAGGDVEDFSIAVAAMAKAGIEGSDAGTSLKSMYMNLQPTTKAAIKTARELGLITKDGSNQFFDAAGNVKSYEEISAVLAESLKGLTKEQQLSRLETLFGSDAIRAAAVAAKLGAGEYGNLGAQIREVNAGDVAAKRMDSLKGSIEQFKGSAETAGLILMSGFSPSLKTMFEAATEGVNASMPYLEDFAAWFDGELSAAIIKGKDLLRQLADAWRTVQQAFDGQWAPDESIEPLAQAAGKAALKLKELRDFLQQVADRAGQMGAWDSFRKGADELAKSLEQAGKQTQNISTSLAGLDRASGTAGQKTNDLAAAVKLAGLAFHLVSLNLSTLIDAFGTLTRVTINGVTAIAGVGRALDALRRGDMEGFKTGLGEAKTAMGDMWTAGSEFAARNSQRIEQGFKAVADAARTDMPATKAAIESNMSAANQAVGENSAGMAQFMEANGAAMTTAAETAGQGVATATETGMTQAVSAVVSNAPLAVAAAEGMGTGMATGIEAAAPAMATAAESGATQAVAAVEGQTGAANAAGASVGQNLGAGMVAGIGSYIGAVAAKAVEMVRTALGAANAEAAIESPSKKTMYMGQMLDEGLIKGIEGSAPAVRAAMRDLIQSVTDYAPVAGEIARVEREINAIRNEGQTAALFRGEDMITIESELLRLKRDQVDEERRLLPIREDVAAAERAIRDITNGSLGDRSALLENDTQRKQIRLQTLDLEKQLVGLDRDSKRAEGIQKQIDKLRDQDRLLGIEAERIRLTNDIAATSERRRVLGLGEILTAEERNIQAIGRQIAVLGAEEAVFRANEAIIKGATENEIAYRQRLIAVFNAEGKPLQDRMTAGLALVNQLEAEGKISKELADQLRSIGKEAGVSTTATSAMGAAAATAAPQIDAAAKKAKEMADQAGRIADEAKDAGKEVSVLANMLGKLPSWFTPKSSGGGGTSKSVLFGDSVATTATTRDVASLVQPVALAGVGAAPGGVTAGPMQQQNIDINIGGTTLARLVATGMRLELRRVGTLPGLNGGI